MMDGNIKMNFNRAHAADLRARKMFKKQHGIFPENISESKKKIYSPSIEGILGIYRKTRVFCSSPLCCGNPRKIRGCNGDETITVQERKAPTINEIYE